MKTKKTAHDYQIGRGRGGLKYYRYFSIGLASYKSKSRIVEALNLRMDVYRIDKIMNLTEMWDGNSWVFYHNN